MAKPLRPKRGTTAKNDAFTGLASEITIDTEKHSIRVHDGVTAGGHALATDADLATVRATAEAALPKSGGTMTGGIVFSAGQAISKDTDEGALIVSGGKDFTASRITVFGKSHASTPGRIALVSSDGSNATTFGVNPGGTATLGGNNIITSAGGTFTGATTYKANVDVQATGSTEYSVVQYFKDKNDKSIAALQVAKWENGGCALRLIPQAPDGTQLSGLVVERSANNEMAFAAGGKSIERVNSVGTNYIRFESGLQICWGLGDLANGTQSTTLTFPVAFVSNTKQIIVSGSGTAKAVVTTGSRTSTNFKLSSTLADGSYSLVRYYYYIAAGYWK